MEITSSKPYFRWLKINLNPKKWLDINLDRLSKQIAQIQNLVVSATADELHAAPPMEAAWMWYPEGDPTQSVSADTCYFIRPIIIPNKKLESAELIAWADDIAKLYVNGKSVFTVDYGDAPKQRNVKEYLHPEQNILAVEAKNFMPGAACVVLELRLTYSDGTKETITADNLWRVTKQNVPNWVNTLPSPVDTNWIEIKVLGKGLISPWAVRIDWP